MKLLKALLIAIPVYSFFLFSGASLSSCQKQIQHDTTTVRVTINDTIIKKDTVTLVDTLVNLTDGLVAYYNFIGGNLNDSSGNNNNIIFNNATPTSDRFGNANNAFLFGGDSSYMQVKNSASLNPNNISLFAIVKVDGFYKGECYGNEILCKGAPDAIDGLYYLRFSPTPTGINCDPTNTDTTKESFYGSFGDNNPQGSTTQTGAGNFGLFIHPHEWYTLVFTYDGTNAKYFVNGALVSTVANSAVTFNANTHDLFIGKNEASLFPYYFTGVIDEVRIYNKAINNQQVEALDIMRTKYLRTGKNLVY
jgi:hypothetical protein